MKTEFDVRGIPIPQGSLKAFIIKGKPIITASNKGLDMWRRLIADVAQNYAPTPILKGPIAIQLDFRLPKPKHEPKTKRTYPSRRPDIDKLARACLDALTGIIFIDDAQVIKLNVSKDWGDPGVHIIVEEIL